MNKPNPISPSECFDIYQRYSPAANMLNQALPQQHPKILDVGSNVNKSLTKKLPRKEVYCLDTEIPEKLKADSQFIQGNASTMEFDFWGDTNRHWLCSAILYR